MASQLREIGLRGFAGFAAVAGLRLMIYTLECELKTTAPLRDTFAVFENPYNLARITPPNLGFEILTQGLEMREGLEIDYVLRWLGVPLRWRTRITEYRPPYLFVDEAVRSPYALWRHRHTFTESGGETTVADAVEYALPLGILGQAAHSLIVSKQLQNIFSFRQQAIASLLGGSVTELSKPRIHPKGPPSSR